MPQFVANGSTFVILQATSKISKYRYKSMEIKVTDDILVGYTNLPSDCFMVDSEVK
jgi:hypothetical protein